MRKPVIRKLEKFKVNSSFKVSICCVDVRYMKLKSNCIKENRFFLLLFMFTVNMNVLFV